MIKETAVVDIGGGRTIELKYEFNNLCDAEAATGVNLLAAQDHLMACNDELSCIELRALVYATIIPYRGFPEKPEDQVKECGGLINADVRANIMEGLAEAIAISISAEYAEDWRRKVAESREKREAAEASMETENASAV